MRSVASWANRTLIVFAAVVALAPIWFLVIGSLQDIQGVFVMPPRLIPRAPTLEHYAWMLGQDGFATWIGNTVFVVAFSVVGAVVVSCATGYAFAFYELPAKRVLWLLVLAGVLIPRISLIIPQFVVVRRLGLTGTQWAAILPMLYHPVGIFLARTYFETVPRSMLESARLDGASEAQALARIIAPLARPIVTAVALFVAMQALSDYLWQMLQLQRPEVMTLLVGVTRAGAKRGGDIGVVPLGRQMAGAVILLAPIAAVFAVASRYFTSAIGGAVKE